MGLPDLLIHCRILQLAAAQMQFRDLVNSISKEKNFIVRSSCDFRFRMLFPAF
ncbi:hypothetical protein X975_25487, partial [Stegodyphus mimosarum]